MEGQVRSYEASEEVEVASDRVCMGWGDCLEEVVSVLQVERES